MSLNYNYPFPLKKRLLLIYHLFAKSQVFLEKKTVTSLTTRKPRADIKNRMRKVRLTAIELVVRRELCLWFVF